MDAFFEEEEEAEIRKSFLNRNGRRKDIRHGYFPRSPCEPPRLLANYLFFGLHSFSYQIYQLLQNETVR